MDIIEQLDKKIGFFSTKTIEIGIHLKKVDIFREITPI